MKNLYFLKNGEETMVSGPLSDELTHQDIVSLCLDDLVVRKPGYTSHYQRVWEDSHGWIWVDFGRHTEFYVVK